MPRIITSPGQPPITSFSDTFVRADKDTLGPNWVQMGISNPGPNAAYAWGSIQTNQGKFTGSGTINPTGFIVTTWVPLPIIGTLQNERKIFAEMVFQSTGGVIGPGLALKINRDQNLPHVGVGGECYIMVTNGRIDILDDNGVQNTLGAATWVVAAGDTIRFEAETNLAGTAVVLRSKRNGTLLQEITDNGGAAGLQPFGWPGVIIYTLAGTPLNDFLKMSQFNCGKL